MDGINLGLEERVGILEEFVYNTPYTDNEPSVGWVLKVLKTSLLEFRIDGKYSEEAVVLVNEDEIPLYSLKHLKYDLSLLAEEEARLIDDYDRMTFGGKYRDADGWSYLEEIAKETRRIMGLEEDARVNLVEGSKEWEEAKSRVLGKRGEFYGERKKAIDYEAALGTLIEIVGIRLRAYEKINGFREQFESALQMQTGGMNQELIEQVIGYIDIFPLIVRNLIEKFSHPKFLEITKLLPYPLYAAPQQPEG